MKRNARIVDPKTTTRYRPRASGGSPSTGILRVVAVLGAFVVLSLLLAATASAAPGDNFPSVIPLPNGFRPEGIAIGRGTEFFVGSIPTGAIFKGDLRTGEGEVFVPEQAGRAAIGLGYDGRTNYLFVAGGPTGKGFVYDAETGETVATYQFTTGTTFVNDVEVTRTGAFFTDSQRPVIYRVPLTPGGTIYKPGQFEELPLGGEYTFVPGAFNANGIEATPDGRWLIIVHTARGELYRVNPETGKASLINLMGGSVPNGDGLYLQGRTLYVVQNALNQIAVVKLTYNLTSGTIARTITDPAFRVPTTIDRWRHWLYAVNARFDVVNPTPETEYEVVRVPLYGR